MRREKIIEKCEKKYLKKVHKILKTYNSILVKCINLSILSQKNIIIVESIKGMVNAQIEIRKPILYFQEEKSISFILLDGTETYIYILKSNMESENSVEKFISDSEDVQKIFLEEKNPSKNTYLVPVKNKKKFRLLKKNKEEIV